MISYRTAPQPHPPVRTAAIRPPQDRHRRPVAGQPVDLDVGPADHEVGMDRGRVEAERLELGLALAVAAVDRVEDAGAVGDVQLAFSSKACSGRRAGAADARVAVDERDLAEHAGVLVLPELLADQVGAVARVHLHRAAALEPQLEVADDVARQRSGIVERTTPSVRRRSGVVKTSSVGMLTTCRFLRPSPRERCTTSRRRSGRP